MSYNIRKEMAKEAKDTTPITINSFPHLSKEKAEEMVLKHQKYAIMKAYGYTGPLWTIKV